VKGPPYLPSTEGNSVCHDETNNCAQFGNCTSCSTFTQADVDHIKSQGWNFIRLGVVWAGAQPRDEDALDPDFVKRLHAVLDLTDKNNINVMLDNHGDMVGSAGCGNGVPMWIQQKAAPELIGKPLRTGLPYSLISSLNIKNVDGYEHCGENETLWKQHAGMDSLSFSLSLSLSSHAHIKKNHHKSGDPNYNLLNECCQAMNSPNPGGLGYTKIGQATMNYILSPGEGRDAFVRYWRLMAEAVSSHPSAFAVESMNEPMSIRRRWMFDTWRDISNAVTEVVPGMSVALLDIGEGSFIPEWATKYIHVEDLDIASDTLKWIKSSNNLFYAWHWYGGDLSPRGAVEAMLAIQNDWNVPSFATEFMSCDIWNNASAANVSHSYWHYSAYCNTGPAFGNRKVPDDTFGACILGWAGGTNIKPC